MPPFGLAATALLLLVAARWAEVRWTGLGRRAPVVPRALTAAVLGLVLWLGLSLTWARHAGPAEAKLGDWAVSAAVLAVVVSVVRAHAHVRVVVRAFIAGAVVSVVFGLGVAALAPGSALAQRAWFEGRLQGASGDPNFLAAGLVAAIALAVGALAASPRRSLDRRCLLAAIVVLVAGLGATQSRGGILAAAATAALAVALGHGRHRALGLGAVAGLLVAALALSPGGLARIATPDVEGNGRADLWRVAGRMVGRHPYVGVGLANFPVRSADLALDPGRLTFAELIAERPLDAHNTYLQLLAEAGPLGLIAYVTVVGLALGCAWRARRRLTALGERELASAAQSVFLAAIGMLVALMFLTDGDDMRLWILLGLGPALLAMAGRPTERATGPVTGRPAP
jgi:O-antigen ligase